LGLKRNHLATLASIQFGCLELKNLEIVFKKTESHKTALAVIFEVDSEALNQFRIQSMQIVNKKMLIVHWSEKTFGRTTRTNPTIGIQ
jgi:hypothetical protein